MHKNNTDSTQDSTQRNTADSKMLHQMQILEQKYDQLSMHLVRPTTGLTTQSSKCSWFKDYIQKGEISDLSLKSLDIDFISTGSSTNVIIPSEIADQIASKILSFSLVKQLCHLEKNDSNATNILVQSEDFKAQWGTGADGYVTGNSYKQLPLCTHAVTLHDLYTYYYTPQDLLNYKSNIVAWFIERVSDAFAYEEEKAILSLKEAISNIKEARSPSSQNASTAQLRIYQGTHQQPENIPTHYLTTPNCYEHCASFKDDDIVTSLYDLVNSLSVSYSQNAVFIMSKEAYRKLCSKYEGTVPICNKINIQEPALLGVRVIFSEHLKYNDSHMILYGSLQHAYYIVEQTRDMQLGRDPYRNIPNVGLFARKKIGGDLVNPDAIKALLVGANVDALIDALIKELKKSSTTDPGASASGASLPPSGQSEGLVG